MSIPRKPQTYKLYNTATATAPTATLPNIPMPAAGQAQPVPPPPANINVPSAAPASQPAAQQEQAQLPKIPQPKQQAHVPARPSQQPAEPRGEWAGAWLFKTTGRKGAIPPAERGAYFIGGGLLWVWGAWLSQLIIQALMPVFSKQSVNLTAMMGGFAVSGIFMLMEFYIWKGGHSPVVILLGLAIFGMDAVYNIASYMALFELPALKTDGAGLIVVMAGVATALLPEKFMSEAWKG